MMKILRPARSAVIFTGSLLLMAAACIGAIAAQDSGNKAREGLVTRSDLEIVEGCTPKRRAASAALFRPERTIFRTSSA